MHCGQAGRMDFKSSHRPRSVASSSGLNIAVVSDAWQPQVNGVAVTWRYVVDELRGMGHRVEVICAQGSRTVKVPAEPDLRLCAQPFAHLRREMRRLFDGAPPDRLHIATEGPLGWAARRMALKQGWSFTTSYHTRFPEYLQARFRIPQSWAYAAMRHFHRPAAQVLVPTVSVRKELQGRGLGQLKDWARGVDAAEFSPRLSKILDELPRPIFLSVGRVAAEKNLEAFLALDLPGSKVVVGDGPARKALQSKYPQTHWLGMREHSALPALYSSADVFVFPSLTDTFGLVNLEAMACGCPVAAFPVAGPLDVVQPGLNGELDEDLRQACLRALRLKRQLVRESALGHTWRSVAQSLCATLVPCVRPVIDFNHGAQHVPSP